MSEDEQTTAPVLRIVRGDPTAEELAAVVAVVGARRAAGSTSDTDTGTSPAASGWSAYWRSMREPVRPGPGGWRGSALPR